MNSQQIASALTDSKHDHRVLIDKVKLLDIIEQNFEMRKYLFQNDYNLAISEH